MNGFDPKSKSPSSYRQFQQEMESAVALCMMAESNRTFMKQEREAGYDGDDESSSEEHELDSESKNPNTILNYLRELNHLPTKSINQRG